MECLFNASFQKSTVPLLNAVNQLTADTLLELANVRVYGHIFMICKAYEVTTSASLNHLSYIKMSLVASRGS